MSAARFKASPVGVLIGQRMRFNSVKKRIKKCSFKPIIGKRALTFCGLNVIIVKTNSDLSENHKTGVNGR